MEDRTIEAVVKMPSEQIEDAARRECADNMPLPREKKRIRRWLRRKIMPVYWCIMAWRGLASVFDAEDFMYLVAIALVSWGVWRLFGDGQSCIACGLMVGLQPLISLLRGKGRGVK